MNSFTDPDPAERSALNRLFYRDRRPTWFGHCVSQFFCWWARVGLPPKNWVALQVRDRVSGHMRADAVVLPTVDGERYVVSMFGAISDWVQNLQANDGDALISHGGSIRVHLAPVPPEQRAPILREYVRVASSGRKHFPLPVSAPLDDFAAIAGQYPVYLIEMRSTLSSPFPPVESDSLRRALLICGISAGLLYVATDITASILYPGYSFTDQAVSELFAIGTQTAYIVVPLFSVYSLVLVAFSRGIWLSSAQNRSLRFMATMFTGSALVGLLLWNLFPMHMRGAERSLTDTMHLILATNPFVLLTLAFGVAAFRDWFRWYTAATILMLLLPAVFAFLYVPEMQASLPTPGLGLGERAAQYAYQIWQATLATVLLRKPQSGLASENRKG
jgi:hypothetical protein